MRSVFDEDHPVNIIRVGVSLPELIATAHEFPGAEVAAE
jgi:hypothetical protein